MRKCKNIQAREFWLNGKLEDLCCCLFMEFTDSSFEKIFYDDENYEWQIESPEKCSNFTKHQGDSEFYYPYHSYLPKEYETGIEFLGKSVANNKISLFFENGFKLDLVYNPESERSEVYVHK